MAAARIDWSSLGTKRDLVDVKEKPEAKDGQTLYHALAHQLIGDSSKHLFILDETLDHFLRVWVNPEHPLHRDYRQPGYNDILRYLCQPDTANIDRVPRVLSVVANALRVCIVLHPSEKRFNPTLLPECHVVAVAGGYRSQVYDETGENLIRRMREIQKDQSITPYAVLDIGQLRWWWSTPDQGADKLRVSDVHVWNSRNPDSHTRPVFGHYGTLHPLPPSLNHEFDFGKHINTAAISPDDYEVFQGAVPMRWPRNGWTDYSGLTFKHKKSGVKYEADAKGNLFVSDPGPQHVPRVPTVFNVFHVAVHEPGQIQPAIKLLHEMLTLSPTQLVPANADLGSSFGRKATLKPYVAVDAGFRTLLHPFAFEISRNSETTMSQHLSTKDRLCSVLTVAVDRHVVFSFYILNMLQKARTHQAVDEIGHLFRTVIFDPNLIKLWFNFQEDIHVLDATIAHMYQSTPRAEFTSEEYDKDTGVISPGPRVRPVWQFEAESLKQERPTEVTFSGVSDDCSLHKPGTYLKGIACPCRYGNIDFSTLLAHVRQQNNLGEVVKLPQSGKYELLRNVPARSWREIRNSCNYGDFIKHMLERDKWIPILEWLKDAKNRDPNKADFYRRDGLDVRNNNFDRVGYDIGDVVGINLMFKFLISTDDRPLLFDRLRNISHLKTIQPSIRSKEPQFYWKKSKDNIPFMDDNPRVYSADLRPLADRSNDDWDPGEKANQWTLADSSYMSHEERAAAANVMLGYFEEHGQPGEESREEVARGYVAGALLDPCKFTLPGILFRRGTQTEKSHIHLTPPVGREGHSHSRSLVDAIRVSGVTEPPQGLQNYIGLEGSRVLTEQVGRAFGKTAGHSSVVAPSDYLARTAAKVTVLQPASAAQEKLKAVYDRVQTLKRPYAPDQDSVWDEWGEEYAERLAKTPKWNQPKSYRDLPAWDSGSHDPIFSACLAAIEKQDGGALRRFAPAAPEPADPTPHIPPGTVAYLPGGEPRGGRKAAYFVRAHNERIETLKANRPPVDAPTSPRAMRKPSQQAAPAAAPPGAPTGPRTRSRTASQTQPAPSDLASGQAGAYVIPQKREPKHRRSLKDVARSAKSALGSVLKRGRRDDDKDGDGVQSSKRQRRS